MQHNTTQIKHPQLYNYASYDYNKKDKTGTSTNW